MEKIVNFFAKAAKDKEYGLIVITIVLLLIVLAGWFGIYWILWDWIIVGVFGFTRFKLTYLEFVGFSCLIRWVLPSVSNVKDSGIKADVTVKEEDK